MLIHLRIELLYFIPFHHFQVPLLLSHFSRIEDFYSINMALPISSGHTPLPRTPEKLSSSPLAGPSKSILTSSDGTYKSRVPSANINASSSSTYSPSSHAVLTHTPSITTMGVVGVGTSHASPSTPVPPAISSHHLQVIASSKVSSSANLTSSSSVQIPTTTITSSDSSPSLVSENQSTTHSHTAPSPTTPSRPQTAAAANSAYTMRSTSPVPISANLTAHASGEANVMKMLGDLRIHAYRKVAVDEKKLTERQAFEEKLRLIARGYSSARVRERMHALCF